MLRILTPLRQNSCFKISNSCFVANNSKSAARLKMKIDRLKKLKERRWPRKWPIFHPHRDRGGPIVVGPYKRQARGPMMIAAPLSPCWWKIGHFWDHFISFNFSRWSIFILSRAPDFESFAAKQLFQNLKQLFCRKRLKIQSTAQNENWLSWKVEGKKVASKMTNLSPTQR